MDDMQVKIQLFVEVINDQMGKVSRQIKGLGKQFDVFKYLGVERADSFGSSMKKAGDQVKKNTMSNKKFITTMLSVMFAASALGRIFRGLLAPALEMSGMFSLIGDLLGVILLPIVLAIMDPLISLLTWFIDLPDSVKLAIGQFILVGAVLFTLLPIILTVVMAVVQLAGVFGGLFSSLTALFGGGLLGGIAAAFVTIGGTSALISLLAPLWDMIKNAVSGVWEQLLKLPGLQNLLDKFGITVEQLSHPWDTLKTKVGDFIKDYLAQHPELKKAYEEFKTKVDDIKLSFEKLWDKIKEIDFKKLGDTFLDLATNALPKLVDIFTQLLNILLKIKDVSDKIGLTALMGKILDTMGNKPEATFAGIAGAGVGTMVGGPLGGLIGAAGAAGVTDILINIRDGIYGLHDKIFTSVSYANSAGQPINYDYPRSGVSYP